MYKSASVLLTTSPDRTFHLYRNIKSSRMSMLSTSNIGNDSVTETSLFETDCLIQVILSLLNYF